MSFLKDSIVVIFLRAQMKSYFKNNKHKLVQTMTPNEGFLENQEKEFER
mgnify:CR=1 FL=1